MAKATYSTVWHDFSYTDTNDALTTGNTTRYCADVVLYDERGPLITNYTNSNTYEFTTKRAISTRAVDTPDWTNPAGFLIEEKGTFRANCCKTKLYVLFVHLDNVPAYAREFLDYWRLRGDHEPGVVGCEFSLEGCKFARFVSNPRIKQAEEYVNEVIDQYDGIEHSPIRYASWIKSHMSEALGFIDHLREAVCFYDNTIQAVKRDCGIVELIHENGADQPIGHNDWYPILRDMPYLRNTYRLETC